MIEVIAVTVGLVVVSGIVGVVAHRHATVTTPQPELGPISTAVRVLRTEDDLRDAIERAVASERVTADRASARIDRYRGITITTSGTETNV